jgi:flagellar M-ring protein FliF
VADSRTFGEVMSQLASFSKGLTGRQKLTLAAGAVVVAATLFVFVRMIRKPEYRVLYSGMTAADAQALAAQLAEKRIQYQVSPDGTTVSVADDQLDKARLEVATQGAPQSGRMGFELFDKPNWASTDFSEKVNYQRALEGELERTIQTLDGVEAVRVHLVLPPESVFVEDRGEAKAAVTIKVHAGRYSPELRRSIAMLVASAVDRLRPESVTVVDADTNRPAESPSGSEAEAGHNLEQELADKLARTLEPVVGSQQVRASVRVEYDETSSDEQQETYDPKTTVALSMQKTEERSGGTGPIGVPGTASNVPGSQASQSATASRAQDNSQSSSSESGTYAVNKLLRHTIIPAGRVKRIAAALIVDDVLEKSAGNGNETRRKRTSEELKQIEEIAKAAIGIDASRGDILVVQNLSFQTAPPDLPIMPTRVERVREVVNKWFTVLRFAAISFLFVVVYLLILRPVKKQAIAAFRDLATGHKLGSGTNSKVLSPPDVTMLPDNIGFEVDASPEVKRTAALKRHLSDKVKAEPVGASRLVQSWIRDGGLE